MRCGNGCMVVSSNRIINTLLAGTEVKQLIKFHASHTHPDTRNELFITLWDC